MKEETRRIMKLVQEGKLSPDDAAELIEAFNDAPDEPHGNGAATSADSGSGATATTGDKTEDPFSKLIGSIEKIGKDVAKNVNWNDIAVQVRQGVGKGVEAIKNATDEAKKGGGFAVLFGSSQSKRVELPLTVPEGKKLRIETRSGDVSIVGGAESGSLVIDAVFRSYDMAEAKKMADAYTPVLEEGDQYVVFRQPEGTNVSTNVSVQVPSGVPVEVKLTSGDVTVTGTNAPVKIDGTSGDVSVSKASGAIQIAQRSGDVKVKDVDSTIVAVETKSGDIELTQVTGVVEVKTSSGDVDVKDSKPKSLSIEAASGDVDVDLAAPVEGTVNLTAVSGDVNVLVMDGSDCRVSLSTLRGSVNTRLELTDETRDEQKVTGRLGAGTGSLEVSVVTGSVSLGLRDSTQS